MKELFESIQMRIAQLILEDKDPFIPMNEFNNEETLPLHQLIYQGHLPLMAKTMTSGYFKGVTCSTTKAEDVSAEVLHSIPNPWSIGISEMPREMDLVFLTNSLLHSAKLRAVTSMPHRIRFIKTIEAHRAYPTALVLYDTRIEVDTEIHVDVLDISHSAISNFKSKIVVDELCFSGTPPNVTSDSIIGKMTY